MKRRRTVRHILRKMHGLGRRYTDDTPNERLDQLLRLVRSYNRQYWHLVPRIGRLGRENDTAAA